LLGVGVWSLAQLSASSPLAQPASSSDGDRSKILCGAVLLKGFSEFRLSSLNLNDGMIMSIRANENGENVHVCQLRACFSI